MGSILRQVLLSAFKRKAFKGYIKIENDNEKKKSDKIVNATFPNGLEEKVTESRVLVHMTRFCGNICVIHFYRRQSPYGSKLISKNIVLKDLEDN